MTQALDEAVQRELMEAEIEVTVDNIRRQGIEVTEDISANLRAQLSEFGLEDPEQTVKTTVTTTAAPLKLWHRETGEPSAATTDSIGSMLKRRFGPDHPTMAGQRVWTTVELKPVTVGHYKCPLHPESEDRALMTSLGLGHIVCKAAGLRTTLDIDLHLKFKHRRSYDVLQKHREDERHREQMEMMRMQTEAFQRMAAAGAPAETASPPKRQLTDEQREAAAARLTRGRETVAANRAARATT